MPGIQPRFTPLWEREVAGYYKAVTMEREPQLYSSSFGKNGALRETIRRSIDPRWPNIVYVGLGRGEGATDYLEVAGLLETVSRNYQMTLLDNDLMALENARTRRTIRRDIPSPSPIWQQYLSDTGQTGANGEATVPQFYERKRYNRDITFLMKDIVKDSLDMREAFDISHCVDVLCFQTDEDIQLLALQKLGYVTKPGGLVIVDDGPNTMSFKNPRIKLKIEKWGRDLHLKIEKEIERLEGRYLLLRKQT